MNFFYAMFLTSVFLALNLHCEGTRIESRSLAELRNAGWIISGTTPAYNSSPGQWKAELRPLNASVSGGSVWRVTSSQDTLFRLSIPSCHITNIKIYVTYFMENALGYIYPCTGSKNFSQYCNLDSPNDIEWIRTEREIEATDYETVIEIKVNVLSGGYAFFDQITVEHDGLDISVCESFTTEDPATSPATEDDPTTPTTEDPTTPTTEDPTTPTTEDPTTPTTEDPTTEEPTTPTTEDPTTPTTEDPTTEEPTTPTTEDPTTPTTEDDRTTFSTTEDPATPPTSEDPTSTELPDPNSCNHDCKYRRVDCHVYYTCVNFTYKEFHSCALEDGLAFNPSLNTCDLIENVDGCRLSTSTPPSTNCICEYRPDETDCNKYFFCPDSCQENLCEHRSCPSGLAWTVDKYGDGSGHQQCTLPQNATCAGIDPIVEFTCKKKANGNYRNPKNCHSFWKCLNGQALLYDCPHDLIYNPDILECDFPSKAIRFCDKF